MIYRDSQNHSMIKDFKIEHCIIMNSRISHEKKKLIIKQKQKYQLLLMCFKNILFYLIQGACVYFSISPHFLKIMIRHLTRPPSRIISPILPHTPYTCTRRALVFHPCYSSGSFVYFPSLVF
jgi:hypothetical protein